MREALNYIVRAARSRPGFHDLERKFFFVAAGGEVSLPEASDSLDDLIEAVLKSRKATIRYRHFQGNEERMVVEPLSIAIYEHQLYVVARHNARPYPFRFARILEVDVQEDAFEYPSKSAYDPSTLFRNSFGVFVTADYPPQTVKIRLSNKWETYAYTHRWHPSQETNVQADGVLITLLVRTCPELEAWILGFGEDAEVLVPDSLRRRIAQRHASAAGLYSP